MVALRLVLIAFYGIHDVFAIFARQEKSADDGHVAPNGHARSPMMKKARKDPKGKPPVAAAEKHLKGKPRAADADVEIGADGLVHGLPKSERANQQKDTVSKVVHPNGDAQESDSAALREEVETVKGQPTITDNTDQYTDGVDDSDSDLPSFAENDDGEEWPATEDGSDPDTSSTAGDDDDYDAVKEIENEQVDARVTRSKARKSDGKSHQKHHQQHKQPKQEPKKEGQQQPKIRQWLDDVENDAAHVEGIEDKMLHKAKAIIDGVLIIPNASSIEEIGAGPTRGQKPASAELPEHPEVEEIFTHDGQSPLNPRLVQTPPQAPIDAATKDAEKSIKRAIDEENKSSAKAHAAAHDMVKAAQTRVTSMIDKSKKEFSLILGSLSEEIRSSKAASERLVQQANAEVVRIVKKTNANTDAALLMLQNTSTKKQILQAMMSSDDLSTMAAKDAEQLIVHVQSIASELNAMMNSTNSTVEQGLQLMVEKQSKVHAEVDAIAEHTLTVGQAVAQSMHAKAEGKDIELLVNQSAEELQLWAKAATDARLKLVEDLHEQGIDAIDAMNASAVKMLAHSNETAAKIAKGAQASQLGHWNASSAWVTAEYGAIAAMHEEMDKDNIKKADGITLLWRRIVQLIVCGVFSVILALGAVLYMHHTKVRELADTFANTSARAAASLWQY